MQVPTVGNPGAHGAPATPAPHRLTRASVSAATLKAAENDGDGLKGSAALNDGDAAAQAARRTAINVKA